VLVVIAVIALIPCGYVAVKMIDKAAPAITVTSPAKAVGRKGVKISIKADEPKYGIRELRASLVQGALVVPLAEQTYPKNPWWRFWHKDVKPEASFVVEIGLDKIPELKEGQATIRAEAANDSWAGFGKGRTTVTETSYPVLLTPPKLEVLSGQHYINQGGSECVLYRVGDSAATSGVRVGNDFYKGYQVPGRKPDERFAIFAWPYNAPATPPATRRAPGFPSSCSRRNSPTRLSISRTTFCEGSSPRSSNTHPRSRARGISSRTFSRSTGACAG
jgi:hypothetical protein